MNMLLGILMLIVPMDYDYEKGDEKHKHSDCENATAECQDNDFSPKFDKSPVEDSFNPTICLPFARCGQPEEDQPESETNDPEPSQPVYLHV